MYVQPCCPFTDYSGADGAAKALYRLDGGASYGAQAAASDAPAVLALPVPLAVVHNAPSLAHPAPFAAFSMCCSVEGGGSAGAQWSGAVLVREGSAPSGWAPYISGEGAAPRAPVPKDPVWDALALSPSESVHVMHAPVSGDSVVALPPALLSVAVVEVDGVIHVTVFQDPQVGATR